MHVYSSINNGDTLVELTRPAQWDFNPARTSVVLKTGIASGVAIVLQRITPKDTLYTLFGQGTLLTADQINDAELFDLYLIQELEDELGINAANQWNRQPRYADPNKGTVKETASTVTKKDQLAGDWPIDGKDKFIATTDALSERFDVIVSDTKPPDPPITDIRQPGKIWIDDGTLQFSYWEPAARAWVNLTTTGPVGPPGPNVFYGIAFPPEPTAYGLWYDTNRKELRLRYDDGTTVQWVLAGGSSPPTGQLKAGNGVVANSVHEIQTIDQGVI